MSLNISSRESKQWIIYILSHYSAMHEPERLLDYLFVNNRDGVCTAELFREASSSDSTRIIAKECKPIIFEGAGSEYRGTKSSETFAISCTMEGFGFDKSEFERFLRDLYRSAQFCLIQIYVPSSVEPFLVCGQCGRFSNLERVFPKFIRYSEDYHDEINDFYAHNGIPIQDRKVYPFKLQWLYSHTFQEMANILLS